MEIEHGESDGRKSKTSGGTKWLVICCGGIGETGAVCGGAGLGENSLAVANALWAQFDFDVDCGVEELASVGGEARLGVEGGGDGSPVD